MVPDDILANGLYLDWLIDQAGNERLSTDFITNNALRWYYISNIQDDPIPPEIDGSWTKGISRDIAIALEHEGLDIFVEVSSANPNYIADCISAGVPVPETLFDSDLNWESFGVLSDGILGGGFKTELWMYLNDHPSGVCLSFRRIAESLDPPRGHFDLICFGVESNNACFFESKGPGLVTETNLDSPVDITSILAGEDTTVVAPCTRCHLGENPFIVHPQNTAFADALKVKVVALGNPDSWSGTEYYQAFGVPNWPPNPPPLDLAMIKSDKQCSKCHVKTSAGRFPNVLDMPNPPLYQLYCDTVLKGVLGENSSFETMPMDDISNSDDYAGHKKYLIDMCDGPGEGVLVDNTFEDDPSFVSPPRIVTPLYECAQAVNVDNFIEDAEVELIINDIVVGTIDPAPGPGSIEFSNINQLVEGDKVQTRQRGNGDWSELSIPSIVSNFKDDYPDGLPTPTIDPSTIYACSSVMAVRYDIPGFEVEVRVNGANPVTGLSLRGHLPIKPGKTPFEFNDKFTAQVFACEEESQISDVAKAQRPSSDLLTDAQINPLFLYQGQKFIDIGNLTYGSNSEVLESGAGSLGGFSTPLSWQIFRFDDPLALLDQLVVTQNLCDFSTQPSFSQPPTVLNCSALPAPQLKKPLPGEDSVYVIQPLLGARVRIYDENGNELGDGTGGVIPLNRALTDGEVINAVQQLGDCISSLAFQIEV